MGFMKMWIPGQLLLLLILLWAESGSAVPVGNLNSGDTDLTDLQALLTKNLPGTAEDKAAVVELMLQLLTEIDLPTLCDVIANDTKSKRGKAADTTTVNMEIVLPTVETMRVEASPIAISYFNTIGQTKPELPGSNPRISLQGRKKLESRNPAYTNRGLKHTSVAKYHMSLLDKMNTKDDNKFIEGEDMKFADVGLGNRAISNTWLSQSDASFNNVNDTGDWRGSLSDNMVSNRDLSKHILNSGLELFSPHENLVKQVNQKNKNLDVVTNQEPGSLVNDDVRQNQIHVKSIGIERPKNNLYARSLLKADATGEESLMRMKRRREDSKTELRQRYNAGKLSAGRRRKTGSDMKLKRRFLKEEMLPSRTEYQSDLFEFAPDKDTTNGFLNRYKQGESISSIPSGERSSTTSPQQVSFHASMKPVTVRSNVFGSEREERHNQSHVNESEVSAIGSLENDKKEQNETTTVPVGNIIPTASVNAQKFVQMNSRERLQKQNLFADVMGAEIKTSKLTLDYRINETMNSNEYNKPAEQPLSNSNTTNQEKMEMTLDRANKTQLITPLKHFDWNTELISNLDEFFGPYVNTAYNTDVNTASNTDMNTASNTDDQSEAMNIGMAFDARESSQLPNGVNRDNHVLQSNLLNDLPEDLQKVSTLTDDNAHNYFHINEVNQIIHGARREGETPKSLQSVESLDTMKDSMAGIESNLISYGIEKDSPQSTASGYDVLKKVVESKYEYYANPTVSGNEQGQSGPRDTREMAKGLVTPASIDDSTVVQLQDSDSILPIPAYDTYDGNNVSIQSLPPITVTVLPNIKVSHGTNSTRDYNMSEYVTPLELMNDNVTLILDKRTHDVVSVQQESVQSEPIGISSANLNNSDATPPNSTFDSTLLLGDFTKDGISVNVGNESVNETTPGNKKQDIEDKNLRNQSISAMGNEIPEENDFIKRNIVNFQSNNFTSLSIVNVQIDNMTRSIMEANNFITFSVVQFQTDNVTTNHVGNLNITEINETNLTTKSVAQSHLDNTTTDNHHLQYNNITEASSEHPQTENITVSLHEPQELHVSRVAATFDTHLSPLEITNNIDDIVIHYQTPHSPEQVMPTSSFLYQVDGDQDQEMTSQKYTDIVSEVTDLEKDVRSWKKEQPSELSQSERDFISIVRGNHRGISSSVYNSFLGQPVMKSLKRIHEEKIRSSTRNPSSASYHHQQDNQTNINGNENTTADSHNDSTNRFFEHTISPQKYTEPVETTPLSLEVQELNHLDNLSKDATILTEFNRVPRNNDFDNNESAILENLNLNETDLTDNNSTMGTIKPDALNGSLLDRKNVIKEQVQLLNDTFAQENIKQMRSEDVHANETVRNIFINTVMKEANQNNNDSYSHYNITAIGNTGDNDRLILEKNETTDNTSVLHETLNISLFHETNNSIGNNSHSNMKTGNPVQNNMTEPRLSRNKTEIDNDRFSEGSFKNVVNESWLTDGVHTNFNHVTTDDSVMANSRESQTLLESPKMVVTEINTQPSVDSADTINIMYQSIATAGENNEVAQASAGYQITQDDYSYTTSEPVSEAITIDTTAVPFEEESTTSVTETSDVWSSSANDVSDANNDETDITVTPVTRRNSWAKTIEKELKRAEKFRGMSSFDPDDALPFQFFDRSYSKLGMMNEEGADRFFYHPRIKNRVKPESSPFSAGISSWMKDSERSRAKKVTVNPWKAFNIELGKKKVERQREMTHGSKFQSYPASNIKHREDLMLPVGKDYLWNARPWPARFHSSEQGVNNGIQKQKYRFGITKLNELLRGKQGSMHFEPMRTAHAKQWGDRFSQGYYGRVLEEQNHAPTIIHALGLPPHIDLASYNTHDINKGSFNSYKTNDYLSGKRSPHQDAGRDDFFVKDAPRKWRQPPSGNTSKSKFSTLADERSDRVNFAASQVVGGPSDEREAGRVETTRANPTIDAPVNTATGGDDIEMAPSSVPTDDFKCPGLFGYHSDTKDCNSFYMCSWGVSYKLQCSPGTLWNSRDAVCDWAANVNCDLNQGKSSGLIRY